MKHTSNILLDTIEDKFNISSDVELASWLNLSTPTISKIRNRKINVSNTHIVRILRATKWSIETIDFLIKASKLNVGNL